MRGIDMLGAADAAPDKGKAGTIEHHEAGARAIREIFEGRHGRMANGEWRMMSSEQR
jgi:hypothetical protein